MRLNILGKKFVVRFFHNTEVLRQTIAELFPVLEDGTLSETPMGMGVSLCHWKDNFEKRVGRKIAFTRLLEVLPNIFPHAFPVVSDEKALKDLWKPCRTEAWLEYLRNFKV